MRKLLLALAFPAVVLLAQSPTFEVASIKPSPPLDPAKIISGKLHIGVSIDAARVDIGNLSLFDLVCMAYKMKPYQVNGPDWMKAERFDILAKMPEGATKEQVPEMLQALLADRFKMKVRRDNKEQSIYALVVAKGGPKMKPSAEEPAPATTPAQAAENGGPAEPPGKGGMVMGTGENQVRVNPSTDGKGATITNKQFGQMRMSMAEGGMRMEFAKMPMAGLADMLSRLADRPVVDMTELKGNYEVALELSMDDLKSVARSSGIAAMMGAPGGGAPDAGHAPGDAASTPSSTSIFTAVQQMGLKLDPRKSPVESIVVEHVEKAPTEN
jgi:uncharacterized protein (TIGR03435 family)